MSTTDIATPGSGSNLYRFDSVTYERNMYAPRGFEAGIGQALAFVFGFLGLFTNPFLVFIAFCLEWSRLCRRVMNFRRR